MSRSCHRSWHLLCYLLWHFDYCRFGLYAVTTKVVVVSSRLLMSLSCLHYQLQLVVTFRLLTIWSTCRHHQSWCRLVTSICWCVARVAATNSCCDILIVDNLDYMSCCDILITDDTIWPSYHHHQSCCRLVTSADESLLSPSPTLVVTFRLLVLWPAYHHRQSCCHHLILTFTCYKILGFLPASVYLRLSTRFLVTKQAVGTVELLGSPSKVFVDTTSPPHLVARTVFHPWSGVLASPPQSELGFPPQSLTRLDLLRWAPLDFFCGPDSPSIVVFPCFSYLCALVLLCSPDATFGYSSSCGCAPPSGCGCAVVSLQSTIDSVLWMTMSQESKFFDSTNWVLYLMCKVGHLMCKVGHLMCKVGHLMCEVGYPMRKVGHLMCEVGHPMRKVGHLMCEVGHLMCEVGHLMCKVGRLMCEVGHPMRKVGHLMCEMGHLMCKVGHPMDKKWRPWYQQLFTRFANTSMNSNLNTTEFTVRDASEVGHPSQRTSHTTHPLCLPRSSQQ